MTPEIILDLLGHSIHHPAVEELFNFFNISERPTATETRHGISIPTLYNHPMGVYLSFTTAVGYENTYGSLKSKFTEDRFEVVLNEVYFGGEKYPHPFPFGILKDDDLDSISKKIGSKPWEKRAVDNIDWVCEFLTADLKVLFRIKDKSKLVFIKAFPIDLAALKKIELRKSLKSQNKNISDNKKQELIALKNELPTIKWATDMQEGDDCFTPENIRESEKVFLEFIDQLITATTKKNASQVYTVVKKATKSFNKLQKKHDGFIETLERDQIIEFFEKAVRLTGFELKEGIDLTQEFREW